MEQQGIFLLGKNNTMNKEEALKILGQLVEASMAQGAIKNFATLDKLREALWTLKNADEPGKS
jgi:hypothetical protein